MVRLLDDTFSKGFETLRVLVRDSRFTVELGDAIRAHGGVERAIGALNREFFQSVAEPTRSWREESDVVYFSVTSGGTTGEDWITRLESKGFSVGDYAKQALRSPNFNPTNGVTTEVVVLKGTLFEDNYRITSKIRAKADEMKLVKPNAELACLVRELITDKEIEAMGLWYIVAMHEPINDSVGDPVLLGADRCVDGFCIHAYHGRPDNRWNRDFGFAFQATQVP